MGCFVIQTTQLDVTTPQKFAATEMSILGCWM